MLFRKSSVARTMRGLVQLSIARQHDFSASMSLSRGTSPKEIRAPLALAAMTHCSKVGEESEPRATEERALAFRFDDVLVFVGIECLRLGVPGASLIPTVR